MTHSSLPRNTFTGRGSLANQQRGDSLRRRPDQRPDWAFRILVTALMSVAVWLLAMPWVPAIAGLTMHRFHLRTGSFAAWAIQQPIPPMYSFANTTEVWLSPPEADLETSHQASPLEQSESIVLERAVGGEDVHPGATSGSIIKGRMINHFPTREFTFANARVRYLRDRERKWFVLRSTYRGQTLKSVYRLDPAPDLGWTATLLDDNKSTEESES